MNSEFWRGKCVLLSGHTGFKGSWLSLWLQSMGAKVVGYALAPPKTPNMFEIADVAQGMSSIIGDIRDMTMLQSVFTDFKPEIVIHMAAQPLVLYSYHNPVETYATNVMGTVNMLECVRHTPTIRSVVVVTTDKCYENKEWVWGYRENEPMGGFDPYSNSKGCAELVTAAYRSSYFNSNKYSKHGVSLASARAGNVIGGGDWSQDRLIPDILSAFEQGQAVEIRSPHAIRPWQHVMEPLRGYLTLAEKLFEHGSNYSEGWNFGPRDEDVKPVSWIVEEMANQWGQEAKWKIDDGIHPHEAHYLKLDISKARSLLNWHPVLSLKESLALTVDWAKQLRIGASMREVTFTQLDNYQLLITSRLS